MAPSIYLQPGGDCVTYGVESATPAQIVLASAIVDSYLRRPKGLVYATDANGNPCMMVAAAPDMTFTLTGAISAGQKVTATVSPALITPDFVGEVLVLDPGLTTMEVCQVSATIPNPNANIGGSVNNQVILGNVQFAHALGAIAQTGLALLEEKSLPNKRSVTQLSETPAVNLLSLLGRYAYGRRSDQVGGLYQEMNLLAAVQTFGGPPQWIIVNPMQASLSPRSGQLWVPAGMLLAYYSDVRVQYIGGWTYQTLPSEIKAATAAIANALIAYAGSPMSLSEIKTNTSGFKKFTASALDNDIQKMLNPYRSRLNY